MLSYQRLKTVLSHLPKGWVDASNVRLMSQGAATAEVAEINLKTIGNKGLISLTRPKALNALNLSMVRQLTPALLKWEDEDKVLVMIKGEGGKAFCAGGDIRSIVLSKNDPSVTLSRDFFREEYQLNNLIATLDIPYIALIDGITMGGGVGLSVHCHYRVATERTLFAMPETAIGFFPDVGGTYFLPKLKGKLGLFLGLTGYRLKGADVYHAGIATHALNSTNLGEIEQELLASSLNDRAMIGKCLGKYEKKAEFLQQPFSLQPHLELIDECFSAPSVEGIVARLESRAADQPFVRDTLALMNKMSPLSMKITHRALELGSSLTLAECLQMEYRLSQRFCAGNDFAEGVRAMLIDKDQKPQWKPSRLEDCTEEMVEAYFQPLTDAEAPELEFL